MRRRRAVRPATASDAVALLAATPDVDLLGVALGDIDPTALLVQSAALSLALLAALAEASSVDADDVLRRLAVGIAAMETL